MVKQLHVLAGFAAAALAAGGFGAVAVLTGPSPTAGQPHTDLIAQVCSDGTHVDLTWRLDEPFVDAATVGVTDSSLRLDGVRANGTDYGVAIAHTDGATELTLLDVPTVDSITAEIALIDGSEARFESVSGRITADCTEAATPEGELDSPDVPMPEELPLS